MPSVPPVELPPQPWPRAPAPVPPAPAKPETQKSRKPGFFQSLFGVLLLFAFVLWMAIHFGRDAASPHTPPARADAPQQSFSGRPVEITYDDVPNEYLTASKQAIAILLRQCPGISYSLTHARTAKATMHFSMPWMPPQHDYGWHYYLMLNIDPADMSPRGGLEYVSLLLGAGRHPGFVPWVGMPARMCNHPIHQLVPIPALSVLKAYDAEDKVMDDLRKNKCLDSTVQPLTSDDAPASPTPPPPPPKGCPGNP
jgi:hypothetical protein